MKINEQKNQQLQKIPEEELQSVVKDAATDNNITINTNALFKTKATARTYGSAKYYDNNAYDSAIINSPTSN